MVKKMVTPATISLLGVTPWAFSPNSLSSIPSPNSLVLKQAQVCLPLNAEHGEVLLAAEASEAS